MKICNETEIKKLFGDRKTPSETLYYMALCYYSALRVSEALQYDGSNIITGKGGHERFVYFSKEAEKYAADVNSKQLTRHAIYNRVYRASARALGYGISPHDLRRSRATVLYKKTHNISKIQMLLGHKDASTTFQYIIYEENDVEKTYRFCFSR
ncbi:putative phage integrase [Candidatus Termititenax aidoneus]|uniref:Phage integrase n=1 Tax=Termititenax aidoneus TaxID=2218524 RepID=A0A388T829_TERA1|nr:putative phage integrase [Candidatus Termititenax aidoneus]